MRLTEMARGGITTLNQRANNFDFIRCLAAFFVLYGHSATLLGLQRSLRLWGTPIETLGVEIFFSISGYLVTESWQRDPRLLQFFAKRILRLFPALIVCVVLLACILGPLVTDMTVPRYFEDYYFADYFRNLLLLPRFHLPGVFFTNTYPVAVNGSLWTIPVEFFCYASLAALAVCGRGLRLGSVLTAALVAITCGLYFLCFSQTSRLVLLSTSVPAASALIPFFCTGSALCLAKDRISLRMDVAACLVLWMFAAERIGWRPGLLICGWLALPYIVLTFGASSAPLLRRWARWGDFSYGVYLYAFPIQQLLIHLSRGKMNFLELVVIASIVSLAAAWCSWNCVERPALRLKPVREKTSVQNTVEPAEALASWPRA